MGKVRRIDYFPDEFLAGVDGMSLEQVGCYWLICSKIYSRGSAIPDDDAENARIFRVDPRTWRRVKVALIAKRKLRLEAGHIVNGRCATELSKAHKRIEDARKNGSEGGRPPGTSAGSPPDDSPMVAPTIPESLANRSPIVANKSGEVLSEHSDLAKAAGFSGEKLTSNQQPPTTNHQRRRRFTA